MRKQHFFKVHGCGNDFVVVLKKDDGDISQTLPYSPNSNWARLGKKQKI